MEKSLFARWVFCAVLCVAIGVGALLCPNCNKEVARAETVAEAETLRLPIVMYHRIAKSGASKYSATVGQLESDIKAFKEAGYTAVFMSEVIDWVDGKGTLPEKPMVITFDDGQYNNVYYGLPLAQKYEMKLNMYPVTSFTEKTIKDGDENNISYSSLTWEQIKGAHDSGYIEFGNHSHKMHGSSPRYGIGQKSGETDEAYISALTTDIKTAEELIMKCGVPKMTTYAYPLGKYTKLGRQTLIDLGYRAMLTCNERVDTITKGKPECLYELGRFNRSGNYSTDTIMKKIS